MKTSWQPCQSNTFIYSMLLSLMCKV